MSLPSSHYNWTIFHRIDFKTHSCFPTLFMTVLEVLTNTPSRIVWPVYLNMSVFFSWRESSTGLSRILLCCLFHVHFLIFYLFHVFCSFFVLVGSGKLTFSWPSPNHRVTVTGTSLPLPIHTLPCPSTNQPPCFTCPWPQRQTAQNKSAGSMGNCDKEWR